MTQQNLDYGSAPSDGTGDNLFTTFGNIQSNTTELYNGIGGLLSKSFTAVPLTGSTSETALVTVAVPAGAIGANGVIRLHTFWSMPSSVNQKSMRVRLGAAALAGSVVSSVAGTTIANAMVETSIVSLNATNSQLSMSRAPRGTDYLVSGAAATATSIDMTAAQNIVITGQLANSGETLTLLGYIIQFVK